MNSEILCSWGECSVKATLMNAGWLLRVDSLEKSVEIPLLLGDDDIRRLRVVLDKLSMPFDESFDYWCHVIAGAARVSLRPPFH